MPDADARGDVEDLALLKRAASEAGSIAMRYFRRDPKVWWKPGDSPVSEADYAVDDHLRSVLLAARPDYGWVSEEMQEGHERDAAAGRFFVVDPIDGTRAYLRGETTWCVSIAIVAGNRPIAGVIAATALGEFFAASAGGAATMNDEAIRTFAPPPSTPLRLAVPDSMRRRLEDAGTTGFTTEPPVPSLAYRLALVACGRLEGTLVRPRANDWDIAAADLLIERAGGCLVDRAGEPILYTSAGRRHGLLMAASRTAMPRVAALASTLAD